MVVMTKIMERHVIHKRRHVTITLIWTLVCMRIVSGALIWVRCCLWTWNGLSTSAWSSMSTQLTSRQPNSLNYCFIFKVNCIVLSPCVVTFSWFLPAALSYLKNEELRICVVGLHCCGDLTPSILTLFTDHRLPSLISLVLIGCCYHKTTSAQWSPVSSTLGELLKGRPGLTLNTFALRLAAQETRDRYSNVLETFVLIFNSIFALGGCVRLIKSTVSMSGEWLIVACLKLSVVGKTCHARHSDG